MSREALRWAREQKTGSPATKAVLLVLADHADKTGLAWPATRTLAEVAECDQRTVRRHLARLRDLALVSWSPGSGRGSNRYQLAIGSEAPECRTTEVRSEAPKRRTAETRSAAPENRSAAPDHRSEAPRVSDQQEREQNANAELKNIEEAAPPPYARGGARETVGPAALAATATHPAGYRLVSAWAQRNPGVANGHRRELGKAVDDLLAQGVDPAHIPAALDVAHEPRWRNPVKALPMAYEDVRRAAAQAAHPGTALAIPGAPPARIPTTTQRFNDARALRRPEAGGTP